MRILSFHLEEELLKIAILTKSKKQIKINYLDTYPIDEKIEEDVKRFYIKKTSLFTDKSLLVTGLDSWDVVLRKVGISLQTKQAILHALPYEIESIIPYSLDEIIILPFLKLPKHAEPDVTVLTCRKELLSESIKTFDRLNLEPDSISCAPAALFRLAKWCVPTSSSLFLFHLGKHKSTYALILNDQLNLAHSVPIGLQTFFEALANDLPGKTEKEIQQHAEKLDLFLIDSGQYPHLARLQDKFQKRLDRIGSFLKSKPEADFSPGFFFTGKVEQFFNLQRFLERHLGPSAACRVSEKSYPFSVMQEYAIPIGLGLDFFANDDDSVEFRIDQYTAPRAKKRKFMQMAAYFSLCGFLFLSFLISGLLILKDKETVISKKLDSFLAANEQGSNAVNKKELEEKVAAWEKTLSPHRRSFPYQPNIPLVSDVLAWVSSHPQLALNSKEKDKIEVKHLNYALSKYPRIGENTDPYQVKVDLEFMCESPRLAREFHDALLGKDPLIDHKHPVAWNVHQNTYHSSFVLKSSRKAQANQ